MSAFENDAADEPSPVMLALREYQAALDQGAKPDREEFLARHADISDELAECLDGLEYLLAAAPRLSAGNGNPVSHAGRVEGTLGDFRLVREIGRGGMGVVYEAVQISLQRRVALKVLPVAATFDSRQLQRFENEARAAAGLHHTHIVPVFGVGCERGVPYYAMQLIDGRPLSDIIDELRHLARPASASADTAVVAGAMTRYATDSRAFFETVATIGMQAADALDYAHQMGVVHRDIKPANLLLDGRDHLWVTDFGLARIQTGTGATAPGDMVGTLRYMSPEQAGGDPAVDPRSDVYSLGATLYELLCLHPAFESGNRRECLRQVLEVEPISPRTWNRAVPIELETVVLKAMAKSSAQRYGSAKEMADDLRRFLDDRPILARRPSLPEKVRRWARRNPGVLWGSLLALVFVAAGLALLAVFAAREKAQTEAALMRERVRAKEAEERFELARQAADDLVRMSEEELADKPFLEGPRQRLLEAALLYYQKFIDQRRDDPAAQAELIATQARVQKILSDLAVLRAAGQLMHLNNPAVAEDLHITQEQRESLDALFARQAKHWEELMHQIGQLTPRERREQMLEGQRASEMEVQRILNPSQLIRLRQIALQLQGTGAFHNWDVVVALKLTNDQRMRIRDIEREIFFQRPSKEGRRSWAQRTQIASEQIQSILTPEQVQRWRDLTGDRFKGFPGANLSTGRGAPTTPTGHHHDDASH